MADKLINIALGTLTYTQALDVSVPLLNGNRVLKKGQRVTIQNADPASAEHLREYEGNDVDTIAQLVTAGRYRPAIAEVNALVGGGSGTSSAVNQTAHGFVVGNLLYQTTGSGLALATIDTIEHARVIGIVITVVDVDNFVMATSGKITGLSGLTTGVQYWLTTGGGFTPIRPADLYKFSTRVFMATSATTAIFLPRPPVAVQTITIIIKAPVDGEEFIERFTQNTRILGYSIICLTGTFKASLKINTTVVGGLSANLTTTSYVDFVATSAYDGVAGNELILLITDSTGTPANGVVQVFYTDTL